MDQSIIEKLFEVAGFSAEEKADFLKKYERVLVMEVLATISEELNEEQKIELAKLTDNNDEKVTEFLEKLVNSNPDLKVKVQKAVDSGLKLFIKSFQESASKEQLELVGNWLQTQK